MRPPEKLAMEQIEKRINNIRICIADTKIRSGWIKFLREAMCMTQATLAKACGLNQVTILQMEKREKEGKITIQSMRKIAAAMDSEFIYAIVPRQELNEFLKKKALQKAERLVRHADVHMQLEDQRVREDIQKRIERLAEDLLKKGDIW